MSIKLVILGMLSWKLSTGYELKKIFEAPEMKKTKAIIFECMKVKKKQKNSFLIRKEYHGKLSSLETKDLIINGEQSLNTF